MDQAVALFTEWAQYFLMWIGFGLSFTHFGFMIVHAYVPSVPALEPYLDIGRFGGLAETEGESLVDTMSTASSSRPIL